MELIKFDRAVYSLFLSELENCTSEILDVYINIFLCYVNQFGIDNIDEYTNDLKKLIKKEDAIINKYKSQGYDLFDFCEKFIRDSMILPVPLIEFGNIVDAYNKNEKVFLIKRIIKKIVSSFDYYGNCYEGVSDDVKALSNLEQFKNAEVLETAISCDIYRTFLHIFNEEINKDPSNKEELWPYMLEVMVANPLLDDYYINNNFDFSSDVFLCNRLFFEYGYVKNDMIYNNYDNLFSLLINRLLIAEKGYDFSNDSAERVFFKKILEATCLVADSSKEGGIINSTINKTTPNIKILSLYNK